MALIKRRGISIISLAITLVIILILATIIVLTIGNSDSISSAKEARYQSDIATLQEALTATLTKIMTDTGTQVEITPGKITDEGITYTTNNKAGKVIFDDKENTNTNYYVGVRLPGYADTWSVDEMGYITAIVGENIYGQNILLGKGTRNMQKTSFNKPYVPSGFNYLEGTVETGYVIFDNDGNEFVWIPVDGESIKYEKIYDKSNTIDKLPENITQEAAETMINNAGGFYIARYEAGRTNNNTPLSKKNVIPWTDLDYTDATAYAQKYINNDEVVSGLITGTAWDTIMKWFSNSAIDITDSTTFGNFRDSQSPANITGHGIKQVTGYTNKWKIKNIYDIAGNVCEWTSESNGENGIYRGGSFKQSGQSNAMAYKEEIESTYTSPYLGFRVMLYIKI